MGKSSEISEGEEMTEIEGGREGGREGKLLWLADKTTQVTWKVQKCKDHCIKHFLSEPPLFHSRIPGLAITAFSGHTCISHNILKLTLVLCVQSIYTCLFCGQMNFGGTP